MTEAAIADVISIAHARRARQRKLALAAEPIVKSAGGKRRLLPILRQRVPASFGRYIEPFVGGGALYFDLHNKGFLRIGKAHGDAVHDVTPVLCDLNVELIDTYAALVHDVDGVIYTLRSYQAMHTTDARGTYYATRARWNDETYEWDLAERAAAFLYLNRTCFNGLWRVNRKTGAFNVPMGSYKNPDIAPADRLRMAARALRLAKLFAGDYRTATKLARPGDFVFCDSPYDQAFTAYTRGGWRAEDHEQLATEARRLRDLGVFVMLTNHDTPLVRELYEGFHIESVLAPRSIAASGGRRAAAAEVLITSYSQGGAS